MELTVTSEHRFLRSPNGEIWTSTSFPYEFWTRYLEVFDAVNVIARVKDVKELPPESKKADGNLVCFKPLPYYVGPHQFLFNYLSVRRHLKKYYSAKNALIFRVGSQIATSMLSILGRTYHPFGVEVVGDPYEVFAPGAFKHPLRPFFRWWATRQLKIQCKNACAAAYVTQSALQKRYPNNNYTTNYSSIILHTEDVIKNDQRANRTNSNIKRLVFVGTLAQLYKGPDVLIDAMKICSLPALEYLNIQLTIIGDGKHKKELENKVRLAGLEKNIIFLGQLPSGKPVFEELDKSDLFVLPSRQEGLPRAMIEAMARGLPCIGTNVGGIPELLLPQEIVSIDDPAYLARRIIELLQDSKRLEYLSRRNLAIANQYTESSLRARRNIFYCRVKEATLAFFDV